MYCDFYSITNREKDIPVFVEMLVKEIEIIARNHEKVWVFDTIFFGGGTPSLMKPRWMEKIMNALETSFDISNVKEITMEYFQFLNRAAGSPEDDVSIGFNYFFNTYTDDLENDAEFLYDESRNGEKLIASKI